MKIFIVEDLEGELEKNAELALLRLVMASQRGELKLRKRTVEVIGGPPAGPDTIRSPLTSTYRQPKRSWTMRVVIPLPLTQRKKGREPQRSSLLARALPHVHAIYR